MRSYELKVNSFPCNAIVSSNCFLMYLVDYNIVENKLSLTFISFEIQRNVFPDFNGSP